MTLKSKLFHYLFLSMKQQCYTAYLTVGDIGDMYNVSKPI